MVTNQVHSKVIQPKSARLSFEKYDRGMMRLGTVVMRLRNREPKVPTNQHDKVPKL